AGQLRRSARLRERRTDRVSHDGPCCLPARVACQHDVGPTRQRLADRFEGLAPHEHRLAQGYGLEVLQGRGQPPRQGVVASYDTVARHGHYERDEHQSSTAVLRMMTPL